MGNSKKNKLTEEELKALHNAMQRKLIETALEGICKTFSRFGEVEDEDKTLLLVTIAEQLGIPIDQIVLLPVSGKYASVQTPIGIIEWENGQYSVYRNLN